MNDLSAKNFGIAIAYVLPGFVVLWGASCWSTTVQGWLVAEPTAAISVGGFLYATLGSFGGGLTASAVRWLVVDTLHHHTGLRPPNWDFGRLQDKLQAFEALVENHYRYYQFYANMFVAVPFACGCAVLGNDCAGDVSAWSVAGLVVLQAVLFATSRDTLRKYYSRAERLLGALPVPERSPRHVQRLSSSPSGANPNARVPNRQGRSPSCHKPSDGGSSA